MYNIKVSMSPALEKFLTHYPQLYDDAKKNGINKSLDLLQSTSSRKAPYKTGTLRREIKQMYNDKKLVAGTDGSQKYAYIQDMGGVIKPKTKKYLRFQTSDGSWHTVSQVTIKPKHYFFRNAEEQKDKVLNEFVKAFQDMFNRL